MARRCSTALLSALRNHDARRLRPDADEIRESQARSQRGAGAHVSRRRCAAADRLRALVHERGHGRADSGSAAGAHRIAPSTVALTAGPNRRALAQCGRSDRDRRGRSRRNVRAPRDGRQRRLVDRRGRRRAGLSAQLAAARCGPGRPGCTHAGMEPCASARVRAAFRRRGRGIRGFVRRRGGRLTEGACRASGREVSLASRRSSGRDRVARGALRDG